MKKEIKQQLSFGYGYDKFIKVYAALQDHSPLIQNSHYNTDDDDAECLLRSTQNTTFSYTLGRIKRTNTCTEQQTISSLCKTSEKIICDFTGKTNLPYNYEEKCNGLQIEGNFNSAISYFCNIWGFEVLTFIFPDNLCLHEFIYIIERVLSNFISL